MSSRRSNIVRGGLVAVGLGLVLPFVAVAPAQAAASCGGFGDDGTYATADCTGVGYARVNVRCNAIWPFSGWTDYGPWVYINGGLDIVNPHISCAASTTVFAEYK